MDILAQVKTLDDALLFVPRYDLESQAIAYAIKPALIPFMGKTQPICVKFPVQKQILISSLF